MGETELLKIAAEKGIWAVLFITLFLYQLRDSRNREAESKLDAQRREEKCEARENKLTEFLDGMHRQLEGLVRNYDKLEEDVKEIKDDLRHK